MDSVEQTLSEFEATVVYALTSVITIVFRRSAVENVAKWFTCPMFAPMIIRVFLSVASSPQFVESIFTDVLWRLDSVKQCIHRISFVRDYLRNEN